MCHYGSLGEKAHRRGPAALKPPSTLVAREEKKDSKSREGVFFRKRKRGLQKKEKEIIASVLQFVNNKSNKNACARILTLVKKEKK